MIKREDDSSRRAKLHYAEDFGLAFEQEGLPRMAGRIFGWMLVAESPHQSLQELAEALRASKGSISNMTRYLMQLDVIERVGLPARLCSGQAGILALYAESMDGNRPIDSRVGGARLGIAG